MNNNQQQKNSKCSGEYDHQFTNQLNNSGNINHELFGNSLTPHKLFNNFFEELSDRNMYKNSMFEDDYTFEHLQNDVERKNLIPSLEINPFVEEKYFLDDPFNCDLGLEIPKMAKSFDNESISSMMATLSPR